MNSWRERLEHTTLDPARKTTRSYYVVLFSLLAVTGWGVYAYSIQVRRGLVVTGMTDRISWGLYITMFVFFIGISHAGTLISAILRVSHAGWRSPVTRMAEFITAVALTTGALFVIVDLGRPDRFLNVLKYGRWQSPIVWDVVAVTTYLTASMVYLYLPMVPDLAFFRDKLAPHVSRFRRLLYRILAVNWKGTNEQKHYLGRAIAVMMVLIIPIAVSVHTVVSWIFAMTLREAWNSTIFGFFFVAGAIFSGIATLIVVMAILRRVYHLEEYITPKHFLYLGYLMSAMAGVMIYANLSEYITAGFKFEEGTEFLFRQLFVEEFAPFFWFYFIGGLLTPVVMMFIRPLRTISGIVTAAVFVDLGMFVERYFIVVTGLRAPLLPYEPASYAPTWVEWSITAGGFAFFALLITVFVKLFPIMAVWEMTEERELELEELAAHRLPDEVAVLDSSEADHRAESGGPP
ncbi:MAG: polysulfide reductase NrfD [Acidimicrobiia bacterium]|nr:polysulfide reductase NrfD [Acidimicrobiia bacterium]